MDKRFDKLEEELASIGKDIGEIKIIQAEQAKDLKYHILRTTQIEEKLIPIVELKLKLDGAYKLVGMGVTGLGLLFGAIKAIEFVLQQI